MRWLSLADFLKVDDVLREEKSCWAITTKHGIFNDHVLNGKPIAELRSVACHSSQVETSRLSPSQTGRYSIYLLYGDGRLS